MQPAVSVITIVKNNEKLLPRALDSVLAQNFTDFEHIIVNDGSTDGTMVIIEDYARKYLRVKPHHLPRNGGRAMARNVGLGQAKGKYIFFLDSDDYLPKTALMDLYEIAEKDNADIVYGRIISFDQLSGMWIRLPRHYTDSIIKPKRHNFCIEDNLDLVDDHSILGRLYRLEMLTANNISFGTLRKNGEDLLFAFYTAFYAKRLSTLPEKIVYFYNAGNYLAKASEEKIYDARDNVLETLEFSLRNGSEALKRRMRRKAAMFAADLTRAQKVCGGQQQKFMQYLTTLAPLVEGLPGDVLNGLPSYQRRFANALILRNFDEAFSAWENYRIPTARAHLAHQLAVLYNFWSWHITSLLRWICQLLSRPGNIKLRGKKYT